MDGDSLLTVALAPSIGVFVADGLELSLETSVGIVSGGGQTVVTLAALTGLSYNFDVNGAAYPFLGMVGGVVRLPEDIVRGVIGAELGVKVPIGGGGLISPRIQLLAVPTDPLILTLGAQLGVAIFF